MSNVSKCQEPALLLAITHPKASSCFTNLHSGDDSELGPFSLRQSLVEEGYRYESADGSPTLAVFYELKKLPETEESQYPNGWKDWFFRIQDVVENDMDVPEKKIYKHISTRGRGGGPAPVLTRVSFVVQCEDVDEVNRWYEEQHIQDLSDIPGWRRSRRYQLIDGDILPGCVELFAVHDFDQENGLGGPEHMRARSRPWREKIVQLAKSRDNREFRFCDDNRANGCNTPPETPSSAHTRGQDGVFMKSSSRASGHECAGTSLVNAGLNQALLSQVH